MLRNEGSCEILELGLSDKTPPHEQPSVAHALLHFVSVAVGGGFDGRCYPLLHMSGQP